MTVLLSCINCSVSCFNVEYSPSHSLFAPFSRGRAGWEVFLGFTGIWRKYLTTHTGSFLSRDKWRNLVSAGHVQLISIMINVFKEESPKGHFKLIRKPSCDMMNTYFSVKIHTLNPLAHRRPPHLPNCLSI